jgi:hypothetical protein
MLYPAELPNQNKRTGLTSFIRAANIRFIECWLNAFAKK